MSEFEEELKNSIIRELEIAENIFNDVRDELSKSVTFSRMDESISDSKIPGFSILKKGEGEVGDFIALVFDIRNSTDHLIHRISQGNAKVSQLERVYYETTAVNTLGILIVNKHKGRITEFLGDGFLALFEAKEKNQVYTAHRTAKDCLKYLQSIVNPILKDRYNLPELKIGIGLAYSKAIVTLIGVGEDVHAKAIGECIYRASKLSKGFNEICADDQLKLFWPSSKDGTLKFIELNNTNLKFKGYKVS
ncbi:MAG: hypothetical protein ACK4IZ_09715 [Flavobacterium sp.]|uniref:hypothetical protein n=1 Tax=Flavobacterium sp. TaxID=239 RepID=UPI00391BD125